MIGVISPGAGLSNFQNGGLLQGSYSGGDGYDTITNDGTIRGSVYVWAGGSGITNDGRVTGTIGGGIGDDQASGGAGNDYVSREDGDDLGDGGWGNDSLCGGYANTGADTLYGGEGRDQLYGGLGADQFIYVAASDSVGSQADRIHDFKHGQDKIDLSNVFAGTLKFMGKAAFADNGIESLRYKLVGKTAQVLVDSDGDGVTDMRILLSNVKLLTAGDFVL